MKYLHVFFVFAIFSAIKGQVTAADYSPVPDKQHQCPKQKPVRPQTQQARSVTIQVSPPLDRQEKPPIGRPGDGSCFTIGLPVSSSSQAPSTDDMIDAIEKALLERLENFFMFFVKVCNPNFNAPEELRDYFIFNRDSLDIYSRKFAATLNESLLEKIKAITKPEDITFMPDIIQLLEDLGEEITEYCDDLYTNKVRVANLDNIWQKLCAFDKMRGVDPILVMLTTILKNDLLPPEDRQ